jgi:integrase
VVEELAEHLGPLGDADAHVFTADAGGVLRPSNFRVKVWLPAVRAAGLAPLRPHDLRHTAVALWIAAGANPKEVSVRAGHTSVAFTLDRYGHLFPATTTSCATAWTPCTARASRPFRVAPWWSCRAARRGPSAAHGEASNEEGPPW